MSNIDPKARTWAEIDMAALKHNYEIARATGKKHMGGNRHGGTEAQL